MRLGADHRRAFATFLVIWVLALSVVMVGAVQESSFRQAASGREAMARLRASWAARAGVEAMIALLEYDTENPDPTDAFRVQEDMARGAEGDLAGASYLVAHTTDPGSRRPGDVLGPADAHAKVNLHMVSASGFLLLPYMTQDLADAIMDWIDADDDVRPLGAEIGQYQGGPYPYEPRNGPLRSLVELELVAGVDPWYVRGEDWNQNGLRDPEEDDGDASWPADNRDGRLDGGWSSLLTVASTGDMLAESGQERLVLSTASENDIARRLNVESAQARAIATLIAAGTTIPDLIRTDLQALMDAASGEGGQERGGARRRQRYAPLTREQMAALVAETVEAEPDPAAFRPGRLNINTCPAAALEYIPGLSAALIDSIVMERESRRNGFTSLVDLLDVPGMSRGRLAAVLPFLTTRSNVYIATSRGVDQRTGIEVEIVATVDRSTLPAVIREWRVR